MNEDGQAANSRTMYTQAAPIEPPTDTCFHTCLNQPQPPTMCGHLSPWILGSSHMHVANVSGGGTGLATLIAGMDQTKTYLVYCHADGPSMAGAQFMEDAGFENVFRLEGNFGAWTGAGYATE